MTVKLHSGDVPGLKRLNDLDQQIDALQRELTKLPQRRAIDGLTASAGNVRTALSAASNKHEVLDAEVKTLDAETTKMGERIKSLEAKLYGQPVPDAKDAHAMTQEIEHLTSRLSEFETKEIQTMEKLEEAKAELGKTEAEVTKLAADFNAARSGLAASEKDLNLKIADLGNERASASKEVSEPSLAVYERLRKQIADPVAMLNGQACGGCHIALSSADVGRTREFSLSEIVTCEECGRILFSD